MAWLRIKAVNSKFEIRLRIYPDSKTKASQHPVPTLHP